MIWLFGWCKSMSWSSGRLGMSQPRCILIFDSRLHKKACSCPSSGLTHMHVASCSQGNFLWHRRAVSRETRLWLVFVQLKKLWMHIKLRALPAQFKCQLIIENCGGMGLSQNDHVALNYLKASQVISNQKTLIDLPGRSRYMVYPSCDPSP